MEEETNPVFPGVEEETEETVVGEDEGQETETPAVE